MKQAFRMVKSQDMEWLHGFVLEQDQMKLEFMFLQRRLLKLQKKWVEKIIIFEYIQMPINAMMPEVFSQEWQPYK
ncbi:unnamed protein product (macronuclear) [Paramecium tetraurelia]|uniref:Uncharacterized protein n=1 Tax=Paramecium tetraurelia TaxID=5888 RepID=A0BDU1_PARTE|nr:uncharacterized protein GSPATT00027738001 [Paramecium tetraurelia]CAK56708.1 unnamed protein product [Paramecium tetraurelia]|eukprot:XP_001424106.1 hypothetical protein (macronuclear) [Paramecium tetraurelia strain d4-2]